MKHTRFLTSPSNKNKRLFILLLFLSFTIQLGCRNPKQPQVCIRSNCFQVELATTPDEREKGLMFRKHLDDDKGMLFIFEAEDVYPFWMKNTLIPLDILWINSKKEVIFIFKNAQPCPTEPCPVINPSKKAKYVLELTGGSSDKIGLAQGDKVLFDLSQ